MNYFLDPSKNWNDIFWSFFSRRENFCLIFKPKRNSRAIFISLFLLKDELNNHHLESAWKILFCLRICFFETQKTTPYPQVAYFVSCWHFKKSFQSSSDTNQGLSGKNFQFERKAFDLKKLKFDSEKLDAKSICNFFQLIQNKIFHYEFQI